MLSEEVTSPQQDLDTLRSLFLKYNVCIPGNLEKAIEAKVQEGNKMKFEDKLRLFKAGTHVFNAPTQEIYDKLMVELEKRGYMWGSRDEPTKYDMYSGNGTCISYEPYMEIRACYTTDFDVAEVVTLTLDDFKAPPEPIAPSSVEYPQPPQELISILRALATCVLIEKTHGVHLNLDELYDKREEYLEKWASEFEVKL